MIKKMNNEYIIINKSQIEKRIEEWETELQECFKAPIGKFNSDYVSTLQQAITTAREILSQSTPLSHNQAEITHWLKPRESFVFTPEQLNEYTANVIKKALETAAENAEITNKAKFSGDYNPVVDEESITDTFEETFKKFEVRDQE